MSLADLAKVAVELYRDSPLMDGRLPKERRIQLKRTIGCIASQHHLHKTISSMRSEGYQENSQAMRVMFSRLTDVEAELKRLEVAYGTITKLPYLT